MRRIVTALAISFSFSTALASEPKTVKEFYKLSETAQKKIKKEKAFEKKAAALQELESLFSSTLDKFEKEAPDEASSDEKEISLLYSTLEPAFGLAKEKEKPDQEKCSLAQVAVETGDSMGRGENPPLTAQAKETLEWIQVLCK